MKKTAAILSLFVFLCGSTELHELLKLPILLHHYIEHLGQNQHKSFADFLGEHYADNINHSDDAHRDHEKLPFKTNDCATIFMFVANTHQTACFAVGKVFFDCEKELVPQTASFISLSVLDNIFQPPKF